MVEEPREHLIQPFSFFHKWENRDSTNFINLSNMSKFVEREIQCAFH